MWARRTVQAADDSADTFWVGVEPHVQRMALVAARVGPPGAREDIVQEALANAWRHRRGYDPRKGSVAGWLLAITANVARGQWRRDAQWRRDGRAVWTLEAQERPRDIESELDLEAAIAKLPKRQRLAVNCFYAAGLTVEETACVMGCTEGTVKSTLADARSHLRRLLVEDRETGGRYHG